MADKKPLYIENGRIQEYGSGDTISTAIAPGTGGGGGGGGPAWSNGSGERRFLIQAAATGGSSGVVGAMLSAVPTNAFYWSSGTATKTLTFIFPSANIVTGIGFSQSDGSANGTWTVEGSNDGVAWASIITNYVFGGPSYGPTFTPPGFMSIREFSNGGSYLQYRLTLNAGSATSLGPYVQQVFFKCEPI